MVAEGEEARFSDVYIDNQMIGSIARFLHVLHLVRFRAGTASKVGAILIDMKHALYMEAGASIPGVLAYIVSLWDSQSISVKELGIIETATAKMEQLL